MEQGMGVTEIASKYGVTRQAVYQRLKEDEKKKQGKRDGIASDPFVRIVCDYFKAAPAIIEADRGETQ